MQSKRKLLIAGIVAGVCSWVLALPATAQTRGEFSAGYQLIHAASDIDETLEKGWYADVAGNLTNNVAAVFQVGGNYKTYEESETISGVVTTLSADLRIHEFMGGIRAMARPSPTVTPFVQVLVGGINTSVDVSGEVVVNGTTLLSLDESDSSTNFGLQTGGGVNVNVSDSFGVRFGADYIRVFAEDGGANVVRVAVGAVFPF